MVQTIDHSIRERLGLTSLQFLIVDSIIDLGRYDEGFVFSLDTEENINLALESLTSLRVFDHNNETGEYLISAEMMDDYFRETKIDSFARITSEVIEYLNYKVGSTYRWKTYVQMVTAILKHNKEFGVNHFKRIIDHKMIEWGSNKDMIQYLRPSTLFGSTKKFDRYNDEAAVYFSQINKKINGQ